MMEFLTLYQIRTELRLSRLSVWVAADVTQ